MIIVDPRPYMKLDEQLAHMLDALCPVYLSIVFVCFC